MRHRIFRAKYIRVCVICIVLVLVVQLYISAYVKERVDRNLTSTGLELLNIYMKISKTLNSDASLDNSKMYKIVEVSHSLKHYTAFDITFVSQCSWNKFEAIENLIKIWQGPVSIAVYADVRHIREAMWKLSLAAHCHKSKRVDLYLVVPFQDIYVSNVQYARKMARDVHESMVCQLLLDDERKSPKNYEWGSPYPVNLLRNVAKRKSFTRYILLADVDMLPNKDLRNDFLTYIWSRTHYPKKIAFVVPSFEISPEIEIPKTKQDLIEEVKKKNARPFYFSICNQCQNLTNYEKWLAFPNITGMRTLYTVTWKHPWEPFFVAPSGVPDYDERFKQYGYNRVSQVCEMHLDGYIFLVVDNAFLVHRGFKHREDFHFTKEIEMEMNHKLYAVFKEEMKSRYPNSTRTCER